jgi:hypothetical protein
MNPQAGFADLEPASSAEDRATDRRAVVVAREAPDDQAIQIPAPKDQHVHLPRVADDALMDGLPPPIEGVVIAEGVNDEEPGNSSALALNSER